MFLSNETFKQNETFLKEIASLIVTEKENNMRVEVETRVLNNIILLTVVTLNDSTKKEEEKFLQNYIQLFFKNVDKQLEDEQEENDSSSHSTVSSILGIQVNISPLNISGVATGRSGVRAMKPQNCCTFQNYSQKFTTLATPMI